MFNKNKDHSVRSFFEIPEFLVSFKCNQNSTNYEEGMWS